MPYAECVCEDEPGSGFLAGLNARQSPEVTEAMARIRDAARVDLPRDCGPLLRTMMGGDPEPGERRPHEHVHRFPEEPEDGPPPEYRPFTVVVKATKRGTCRHCKAAITHGPRGWRDDENGPLAYGCAEAPLGFHDTA